MTSYPNLRRGLAASITFVVVAGLIVSTMMSNKSAEADKAKDVKKRTWSLFGGTNQRNMVNLVDTNVPTEWDYKTKKNIKWVQDLGSKAYGGPVVADGKIFVGTNNEKARDPKIKGDKGIIMCFEEGTGKFLYQTAFDKLPAGRVMDWPKEGICSTPVVEGKRIYYISNRCEVICATTAGKPVWKLDMIGKLKVFPHNLATCSPLIAGDILFLVTSNGVDEGHINVPQPGAPSFLALDKKNGDVIWKSNMPSESLGAGGKNVNIKRLVDQGKLIMHGQWSNPVYAEANGKGQVIFPGGDGWLYSFEPKKGDLLWKFDCNPKNAVYKLGGSGTRNDFLATPVVYDNKVYIGTGQDPEHEEGVGQLWCIDITKTPTNMDKDVSPDLLVKWDPSPAKVTTKPNPESAMVWRLGGKADKDTAEKTGRPFLFGRTMCTCAIHDDLVYACDLSGYLVCLDAKSGAKHWEHALEAQTWSSPYLVDGKVYIGTDDKTMFIFKHGKKKELITKEPITMDGRIRATPVVVNGILYIVTENKLYAIQKS